MSTPDGGDVWLFGTLIALVGLVSGFVARERAIQKDKKDREDKLHDRITRVREDHNRDHAELRRELNEYKLQVQREYASVDHLKEVENRLVKAIDDLSTVVKDLANEIKNALADRK